MRDVQLAAIWLVLVSSPAFSRADDTEKSEIAKIEQTTRVSLFNCLKRSWFT